MNFADAVYIMLPQYTGPLPSETAEDDLADLRLKRLEVLKERRRLIRERDDLERIIRERDHQLAELDEQLRVAELMTQGARHEP
jgi:hypothetical protein